MLRELIGLSMKWGWINTSKVSEIPGVEIELGHISARMRSATGVAISMPIECIEAALSRLVVDSLTWICMYFRNPGEVIWSPGFL